MHIFINDSVATAFTRLLDSSLLQPHTANGPHPPGFLFSRSHPWYLSLNTYPCAILTPGCLHLYCLFVFLLQHNILKKQLKGESVYFGSWFQVRNHGREDVAA